MLGKGAFETGDGRAEHEGGVGEHVVEAGADLAFDRLELDLEIEERDGGCGCGRRRSARGCGCGHFLILSASKTNGRIIFHQPVKGRIFE